jgi:Ca-activated chloride channel family protein
MSLIDSLLSYLPFTVPFTFMTPLWLLALPLILFPFWMDRRARRHAIPIASSLIMVPRQLRKKIPFLRRGGWILRTLSLLLIIVALARPQLGERQGKRTTDGIDVILAIDTSGSMRARDFEVNGQRPDRLEVIKAVIADFIEARPDDRIGMVVFGSEAYTQAPLTLDHDVLQKFLDRVEIGMAGDGTAIGDGLAVAIKRLKDTPGKSHVVILLTDGANNAGRIDPVASAQAAKALGIRVHTIGVGSDGIVPIVQNGRVFHIKGDIDEATLKRIAEETGGVYRRAVDTGALINVYREIDKLEKNRREDKDQHRGRDVFSSILAAAILLLFAEVLWRSTKYRRVPA